MYTGASCHVDQWNHCVVDLLYRAKQGIIRGGDPAWREERPMTNHRKLGGIFKYAIFFLKRTTSKFELLELGAE